MSRAMRGRLVPCALLLLLVVACGADALGAAQGAYLRAVFRDVLHLEPPSPATTAATPFDGSSDAADTAAPRHMMELYRRYAAGGAPRRRQGTTVRSIAPVAGRDRWPGEVLVFNVSAAAAPGEEVTRAHLHLRRRRASAPRRHRGRALAPPARVRLMPLDQGGRGPSSLAALPVAGATRGGWAALDVTAALRELLLLPTSSGRGGGGGQRNGGRRGGGGGGGGAPLLAVRFEAPRGRTMPPHAFLQGDSPAHAAFLIVFSEDDAPGTGDGVPRKASAQRGIAHTHAIAEILQSVGAVITPSAQEPPTKAPAPPDADFYLEPDDEETTNLVDAPPSRVSEDEEGSNMLAALPALPPRSAHRSRRPRSVLDNELPGAHAQPPTAPRTTPESVLSPRRPPPPPAVPGRPPPPPPPASTLPMPGGGGGGGGGRRGNGRRGGRGRGRRRGGEHKKRGRQRLDSAELREREYLPDLNRSDFGLSANATSGDGGGGGGSAGARSMPLCQRKKLEVDFNDIGWGQFIVAPRSFEAHYCAGDCPFPIAKAKRKRGFSRKDPITSCALRPTNHATLQSLVRALGRAPGVPAPCCVPDHLSSLSLLYLDSAGNVVLKNYPNMAVDSCACR